MLERSPGPADQRGALRKAGAGADARLLPRRRPRRGGRQAGACVCEAPKGGGGTIVGRGSYGEKVFIHLCCLRFWMAPHRQRSKSIAMARRRTFFAHYVSSIISFFASLYVFHIFFWVFVSFSFLTVFIGLSPARGLQPSVVDWEYSF